MITDEQRRQYVEEGYFILEGVIPDDHLQILRDSCDHLIILMHLEMDRLGTDHIHISHRGKRYHIAKQYDKPPRLTEYVFSQLMADVCRATIGETAFLFYDQYVVKAAEQGTNFSWHQDSGYLDFNHQPYVTVWAAVDDMTPENGTAYLLPFSKSGIRSRVEHIRQTESGDKVGYFGSEPGIPAIVPAGSLVVFSSLTFHRSGTNTTDRMRRAYVTQYSAVPLTKPNTDELLHLGVPFLQEGRIVAPV
ncbi:MAG: phytanoyl-CoA dioxygenase family protein [Pirellulaceae bacterium]|jgi:ectoine hydroxylase-related dioxygenase (phytanoyl-CoA dioxygenase family)|nr:phytanoyl-CoA dioxygenase family protein [Pirellulaceae bacterium]MDP6556150.1 phytanoyl-CoA dioxygenase family protein [Pirellulaceae bacterium]MDP6717158.1 phytanoyl-CoA dioxygenase family protein [Pirellulaceae bacterium]